MRPAAGPVEAMQAVAHPAGATGLQFRCHGLLRRFLLRQLEARGWEAVSQAQQGLGRWLAMQGDVDSAIAQLLSAGRVDEARAILDSSFGDLLDAGRSDRVRTWIRSAPGLAMPQDHRVLLGAAWSEVLGRRPGGDRPPRRAGGGSRRGGPRAGDGQLPDELREWLRIETDYLRSWVLAWSGNLEPELDLVRRARLGFGSSWERTVHQSAAFHEVRLHLCQGNEEEARAQLAGTFDHRGRWDPRGD